ncbi:unnamed protein product [Closterium sp. NIES-65]|nr:unnamed protein product [Closterium sp. NIES-65]
MKPCRESQESVAAARVRVRHELYAPIEPYRSGTLAVSDVHTVYWEESGNPKGQLYAPIEPYRSGTLAVSDVHTVYWEESGNPKGQLYAPIEPYRSGTLAVSDVQTVYWEESGNPKGQPYRSGTLAVSDVHTVYWEESGNPKGQTVFWEESGNPKGQPVIFLHGGPGGGTSPANRRFFDPTFFRIPVIFLHGGPGGGTSPANRRFFDPTFFRIILLDQRGAGRSTPHACLEENTTWHLVEDIETLRKHLGVDKWLVFGGSWGSTLSLVYAATHPDRVAGLILRGIFLLRRKEVEWFYQKGADSIFPDGEIKVAAARHWTEWEMATSYLLPNEDSLKRGEDDKFALAFARIESHYFVNKGFLPADSFLLDSVPKFRRIPAVIVQGRYDVVCPIVSAWELHKAWPEAEFKIVPDAGHSANEKGISEQLVAAIESFKLKLSR